MMIYRYIDVQKYVKIIIPVSKILKAVVVSVVVGIAYYLPWKSLQVVALVFAVVYAIVENRELLLLTLKTLKNRLAILRCGRRNG